MKVFAALFSVVFFFPALSVQATVEEQSEIIKWEDLDNSIPIKTEANLKTIEITINNKIISSAVIDSGAAITTISPNIFSSLVKLGAIQKSDIISKEVFEMADGTESKAIIIFLREVKLGYHVFKNVFAAVTGKDATILLGQSVLKRVENWSIDNKNNKLILGKKRKDFHEDPQALDNISLIKVLKRAIENEDEEQMFIVVERILSSVRKELRSDPTIETTCSPDKNSLVLGFASAVAEFRLELLHLTVLQEEKIESNKVFEAAKKVELATFCEEKHAAKEEANVKQTEQKLRSMQMWALDAGSDILLFAFNIECPIEDLKKQGYTFLAASTIPTKRLKPNSKNKIFETGDRALTVVGCWSDSKNAASWIRLTDEKAWVDNNFDVKTAQWAELDVLKILKKGVADKTPTHITIGNVAVTMQQITEIVLFLVVDVGV